MWNLGGFPEETNSCKTCWNFFSRGCIIIFMSSFIFDTVSSDAKIYTEKTDYIEGSNVLLACKGSELEMTRWTVCGTDPLNGQSFSHWCKVTPQFRNHPRIKLLQQNCNQAMNWYNLSINGILWEDRGMYECTSGVATHKTITVYVPHKKDLVKIEQIMHRKYFNGTETLGSVIDLRPTTSDDDTVQLMCRSNCANPAPAIKWYGVSGTGAEKEELVIDSLMYNKMSESCADGLKRTISVLNLTAAEKSASQARQNITCELRQDLTQYGGPDIIAKQHMAVLYGDRRTTTRPPTHGHGTTKKPPPTEATKTTPKSSKHVDGNPSKHNLLSLGDIQRNWLRSGFSVQKARMGGLQAQPLSTLEIAGISVGVGIILLLILLGVACFVWSRSRDPNQCEDPEVKEKMNTNDERV